MKGKTPARACSGDLSGRIPLHCTEDLADERQATSPLDTPAGLFWRQSLGLRDGCRLRELGWACRRGEQGCGLRRAGVLLGSLCRAALSFGEGVCEVRYRRRPTVWSRGATYQLCDRGTSLLQEKWVCLLTRKKEAGLNQGRATLPEYCVWECDGEAVLGPNSDQ